VIDLASELRDRVYPLTVVDVGAMILGDGSEVPYRALIEKRLCHVIGFEPIAEECERLNRTVRSGDRYLPYAIGDGSRRIFHKCNMSMTSSLYAPNDALLERFSQLPELVRVVEKSSIETHRLDEIEEVRGADYLKLDVQGAELDVIRGAKEVLKNVVVIETEVEFVPLYEDQPLFAEMDQALRAAGFLFHHFTGLQGRTFRPFVAKNPQQFRGQQLWGDAVYVKSFLNFRELGVNQLLKLAVIMHEVYAATDLAMLAIQVAEDLGGPSLWDELSTKMTGTVKQRPPLL
jgi:FkbM family methyltransferase